MRGGTASRRQVPAVLDVDEWDRLPDQVYVLARSPLLGDAELMVELRATTSGQLALMAYSSLAALGQACGTGQSWIKVRSAELPEIRRRVGFQVIAFDLALPPDLRHPELDAVVDVPDLDEIRFDTGEPGVVYIPSRPYRPGDADVAVELHRAPDGRLALLAYPSAQQLHAGCGPHQPWVALPAEEIERVAAESGAQTVLINAVLAEETRHKGPAGQR
ncbi:SAV_915 family protein [Gandjariella thermophila]|uniref:SseB protein N-terminal domain-containing protein n=1 Tax=Gandjariella thermophila TaxID=1931992 RepID=A0A4D4JE23_9PSEU|nr:SAV_915 family protein [Gandjariella thermophila]GDY33884.1 hypothetical protein GTS_55170 [Gandjariella thermophila]